MRSIDKGTEPQALRQWKRQNQDTPQNLHYDNLPSDIRDAVKEALLREQGGLCAYTLRRIGQSPGCHIEHVEPQNSAPDKDLDYRNMAACVPSSGGDTSLGYGAPVKGGTSVTLNVDFVSPHAGGCEGRFSYGADGRVQARDEAAQATVDLLQLNHKTLQELRRQAMAAHGLSLRRHGLRKPARPLSPSQARKFASEITQADPRTGLLEPFCVALAEVALHFASQEEARARRISSQARPA